MDCGYNCHEKCIESVPKNCTRFKSVRESGVSIQTSTKPTSLDTTSVGSGEIHISTYVVTHQMKCDHQTICDNYNNDYTGYTEVNLMTSEKTGTSLKEKINNNKKSSFE